MEKYKEDEGYIKEEAKVCYTLNLRDCPSWDSPSWDSPS